MTWVGAGLQDEKYFMVSLLPKLQHISREQGFVFKNHFIDFDFNRNGGQKPQTETQNPKPKAPNPIHLT
jgi:hypothetical protein